MTDAYAPPPPIDPRRSAARINRALFLVSAIFTFVGLRFFLDPGQLDRTSIGRALPGIWDEAWSLFYIVGGLLVMFGIGLRRPRAELPGLTLLACAILANAGAIVVIAGERGLAQLPLYALALWVMDGRARDILELPRERRSGRRDQRPPTDRVERRLHLSVVPVAVFVGASTADVAVNAIIALLGGGIVTAVTQAILVKPQRRDLEGRLSKTSVETAQEAIDLARDQVREVRDELASAREKYEGMIGELRGELAATVHRCDELERTLIEHGIPVPSSSS